MSPPRLLIRAVHKSFAVPVLRGVDLSIGPGEVHGLIGENGAGKSTLVNIIYGLLNPDRGEVQLDGQPHTPSGAGRARFADIALASQEMSLIGTLSVAENLLLRDLPAHLGLIDSKEAFRTAANLLRQIGLEDVAPDTPMSCLSLAQSQMLEFGKAIARPAQLLILDEPTAALTAPQVDCLHAIVKEKARAGVAILYISHRLREVLDVCDRISVLRDGQVVQTGASAHFDVGTMIESMSGRPRKPAVLGLPGRRSAVPLLSARGLRTAQLPHPIELDLHGGEVVGLAGLAGAGRTELLEALYGLTPLVSGRIERRRNASSVDIQSAADSVRHGVGMLSEDRQKSGLFGGQSLRFNLSLASLARLARRGFIDRIQESTHVHELVKSLGIQPPNPEANVSRLSGGNQQKALFGRWLMRDVEVLLLDEPTRGVDVRSQAQIHAVIRARAAAGCAVLVVSSELEELTAISDRIVVLSARKLVRIFEQQPFDPGEILSAAFQEYVIADQAMPSDRASALQ